jgi:hypothetical protein
LFLLGLILPLGEKPAHAAARSDTHGQAHGQNNTPANHDKGCQEHAAREVQLIGSHHHGHEHQ